jgi:streptogramin lyase
MAQPHHMCPFRPAAAGRRLTVAGMRRPLAAALLAAALMLVSTPAYAVATAEVALPAAGESISLGPDGLYWVTQPTLGAVVRVNAAGQQVGGLVAVGADPDAVAPGPDGRMWVALDDQDQLVRVDPATLATTTVDLPDGCGPEAMASAGGLAYVSCLGLESVVSVDPATGTATTVLTGVDALDLAASGGYLVVPDYQADVVYRLTLGHPDQTLTLAAPGGPLDVVVDGGTAWLTMSDSNALATFPLGAAAPTLSTVPFAGLDNPLGLAPDGRGGVWVASNRDDAVYDVRSDGGNTHVALAPGASPAGVAATPDGALVTTTGRTAVTRIADAAPTFGAVTATAKDQTSVSLGVPLDTHGNATTVTLSYGASAAYGETVTLGTAAAAATGPRQVAGTLGDLEPGTTYHLRFTATSSRGSVSTADATVTTPAPAHQKVKAKVKASGNRLRTLTLTGLVGGEQVRATCQGRGCPKKQSWTAKGSSLALVKAYAKPLAPGARITVTVSRDDAVDATVTITTRRGKAPKVKVKQ